MPYDHALALSTSHNAAVLGLNEKAVKTQMTAASTVSQCFLSLRAGGFFGAILVVLVQWLIAGHLASSTS